MNDLQNLILIGDRKDISDKLQKIADEAKIKLYTFQEVVDAGAKEIKENGPSKVAEPTPDDVYMLSYTSGTTGDPKGVKIS